VVNNIKRYYLHGVNLGQDILRESPDGYLVEYKDYAALQQQAEAAEAHACADCRENDRRTATAQAEVTRLREALEELCRTLKASDGVLYSRDVDMCKEIIAEALAAPTEEKEK